LFATIYKKKIKVKIPMGKCITLIPLWYSIAIWEHWYFLNLQ